MTVVAVVAARDMGRIFTGSDGPVMAGAASTDNLGVVNTVCGCPDRRVMAILANVAG